MKDYLVSREDLDGWLAMDAIHYPSQCRSFLQRMKYNLNATPIMEQYYIWMYVKTLRYVEYHINNHSLWHTILRTYYLWKLRKLSLKTGFQIPPNSVGPGLCIYHWGSIIINEHCRIGSNVTIYPGVLMGWKKNGTPCPIVGDNVFIGSGTKIIGDVHIGANVIIGQNCVVTKDIPSYGLVVAQQPRVIVKE